MSYAIPTTLSKNATLYTVLSAFTGEAQPELIAKETNYTIYRFYLSDRICFVVSEIIDKWQEKRYEITMYTNLDKHPYYQSTRMATCKYLNEVDYTIQKLIISERKEK